MANKEEQQELMFESRLHYETRLKYCLVKHIKRVINEYGNVPLSEFATDGVKKLTLEQGINCILDSEYEHIQDYTFEVKFEPTIGDLKDDLQIDIKVFPPKGFGFKKVYHIIINLPEDFSLLDDKLFKHNHSKKGEKTSKKTEYEMVNHPNHYNNYNIEVIDMMEKIWGVEATITWCEMTAFKYRMRVGTKPDNSIEQDLKKERWYLDKAEELRKKL